MQKKHLPFFAILLSVFILSLMLPTIAFAEVGMNPSVIIHFNGLDEVIYYVTLLSKNDTTGPYSALTNDYTRSYYRSGQKDYDIFLKFLYYQDVDGYYFLQYFSKCSDNEPFQSGYYPPANFKILVYFPETDAFAVSEQPYERYAFDSSYKVDLSADQNEPTPRNFTITAIKDYDYQSKSRSVIVRIMLTILLEICIALLFKYNTKAYLLIIFLTNLITQTLLYLLLSFVRFHQGQTVFLFAFILLEILVFLIEATIYSISFKYIQKQKALFQSKVLLYSFVANAASFIIGFWISYLIPGLL
ncbi:MAG TPA: hypothetical protein VFF80_06190 [Bacillota bacterium]|nr:hypothetical protein [Bacillota bacterium]